MASSFDVCPECGKRGWYVTPSPWNLSNYRLRECRYCKARETLDFGVTPPGRSIVQAEPIGEIDALYLAGRCANGSELDCGVLYHAVPRNKTVALCGAKSGRRSAGWRGEDEAHAVTCPRCTEKIKKVENHAHVDL